MGPAFSAYPPSPAYGSSGGIVSSASGGVLSGPALQVRRERLARCAWGLAAWVDGWRSRAGRA